MENAFLDLIEKYNGFEFVLGFREDEDHFIGGTGNTVWYLVQNKKMTECWTGEKTNGGWTDKHIVLKKKDKKEEPAESGKAMAMILERAYFKQAEIAASGRKPAVVPNFGYECSHYQFSFGARAYDIVNEYGITVSYSNIDDETAGYRLRDIRTGKDVSAPKL